VKTGKTVRTTAASRQPLQSAQRQPFRTVAAGPLAAADIAVAFELLDPTYGAGRLGNCRTVPVTSERLRSSCSWMQLSQISAANSFITLSKGEPGSGSIGVQKLHVALSLIELSESPMRFENFSRHEVQMLKRSELLQNEHASS